jgi:GTP-binding protein Era
LVIGDKGARIKRIGTEARHDIAQLIDGTVRLELWVKVKSGWADDAAAVRAFGYE